jgi:hypothetical protein
MNTQSCKLFFAELFLMLMTRLMKALRFIFVAQQHIVIIHVVVCYSLKCAKIVTVITSFPL